MNRLVVSLLVLSLTVLDRCIEAKYAFDLSPIAECDNGEAFINIDLNNFQIINRENGDIAYNGSIKFLKDYSSPIKLKIVSKRLQRGTWLPGILNKEIGDFCRVMGNPLEPGVYKTTENIDKRCPFEAGFVQKFDMVEVGSYGMDIPPSFAGDWKFYVNVYTFRNRRLDHECISVESTIYEV
nr:uncharacterized protein LOC115271090 [Aedes albopictus]